MKTIFMDNCPRKRKPIKIINEFVKIDVGHRILSKNGDYRITNYQFDIDEETLIIHCEKIIE